MNANIIYYNQSNAKSGIISKLNFVRGGLLILFSLLSVNFLNAQCNCNTTVANPSITSEFPNPAQVSVTGYCKRITGTYTIDRDFEFINSNLEMLSNSQIRVMPNVTLTINGTKIYGCSNTWARIRTTSQTSKIICNNSSEIHDALFGIDASNGGTVTVDNSIIHNNVGILVGFNANVTVSNNTKFTPNGSFSLGIHINFPLNAVVQVTNSTFTDYSEDFPILANDGAVFLNVKHCTFNISPNGQNQVGCVQLVRTTGIKTVDNCSFTNVENIAVENVEGSGISVINHNEFKDCVSSVRVADITSGSINVSDCTITKVSSTANVTNGIQIERNTESVPVYVFNNYIENANNLGIIHQGLILNQTSTLYSYNTIRNFVNNNNIGMRFISPRNIIGYHNNIFNSISNRDCITFDGGNNNSFYENDLNTDLFLCNITTGNGINSNASQMNLFRCNKTNNRALGFRSNGASDFSTLRSNNFFNHTVGLRIESGSALGVQNQNWNTWSGAYSSGLGAENLNSSFLDVQNSRFIVATPIGTLYHPQNSGNGMFSQVFAPFPTEAPCEPVTGEEEHNALRANLKNSINGLNSNPLYDAVNYDSKLLAYRILDEDATLRSEQPLFSSFYTANVVSSLGKFNTVIKAWKNHQGAVPYPSISTTYNNFATAQQTFVNLLNTSAVASDIENAKTSIDVLDAQYKNEKAANDTYLANAAQQIKSDVNAISASTVYENNIKDFYNIYFSTVAVHSNLLTETQKHTLYAIASQCPLTGGKIVYDARGLYESLYGFNQNFNDDALCSTIGQRSSIATNVTSSIKMFPNPTENQLWIDLGKEAVTENVQLSIFDLNGRLVKSNSYSTNNNPISIAVNDLQNGIYIIQLLDKSNILFKEKLIIMK